MQIHELTRRKTTEGFGSALGSQLMNKAFGGTDVLDKSGPSQSREQGFQSMVNSPAAKTLATTMQAAWAQTVKNFLANAKDSMGNPATSVKGVTQPSVEALKNELHLLINKMIGGRYGANFEYTTMANNVQDQVAKQGIQEVTARITEYMNAIFNATVQGVDPKVLANDWLSLVGDGILPAQNAKAYDNRGTGKIKFDSDDQNRPTISVNGAPYVLFTPQTNPEHKKIADQMNVGKLQ